LADEENLKANTAIKLTLAFPRINTTIATTSLPTYPVFAFLPVCDTGFTFIINCGHWALTTSRESINEHSQLNAFLRDEVVKLYARIAATEPHVRDNLQLYVPKETAEMSHWWRVFVSDVKRELKPIMSRMLASEAQRPRIFNESLADLIDPESERVLEAEAGVKLIYPAHTNMSENELEYYGFVKLCVLDFVECLGRAGSSAGLAEWANSRPKEWWESLFRHLNMIADSICGDDEKKELIRNANMFLIRKNKFDQSNNNSGKAEKKKKDYFCCNFDVN
jgi:hypothetical protein